jgi:hypothetical protein
MTQLTRRHVAATSQWIWTCLTTIDWLLPVHGGRSFQPKNSDRNVGHLVLVARPHDLTLYVPLNDLAITLSRTQA